MQSTSGTSSTSGGDDGAGPSLPERLDYMADLILELKCMAEQSGLRSLAGALGLAHAEARHQLERRSADGG